MFDFVGVITETREIREYSTDEGHPQELECCDGSRGVGLPFYGYDFDLLEYQEDEIDSEESWKNELRMKKEKTPTDVYFSSSYISIESVPIVSLYRGNRLECINQNCQNNPQYDAHTRKLGIEIISEREDSEDESKKSPHEVPMSGYKIRHDGVR